MIGHAASIVAPPKSASYLRIAGLEGEHFVRSGRCRAVLIVV
jgi:hypothetical protein